MSFAVKSPRVAAMGNRVSHAKNRTKHAFKYNRLRATIMVDGKKMKVQVPSRMLRTLKKQGLVVSGQAAVSSE